MSDRSGCIFCHSRPDASAVEHVWPESLGGKEWACLAPDLVCTPCNRYFGSKVEAQALDSYPFLPFRVFLGIPTKKGRPPRLEVIQGTVHGTPGAGRVELAPRDERLASLVGAGVVTQMRVIAEPTASLPVCRLLLKIGLEVLASSDPALARAERFDAARTFARAPRRGSKWWFLIQTDHDRLFSHFTRGVSLEEWCDGLVLEVVNDWGAEILHVGMLGMNLFTPLEPRVTPSIEDFQPPEYQLVFVER